jgi:hypothetical protein
VSARTLVHSRSLPSGLLVYEVFRDLREMSFNPDIKPVLPGPSTPIPCSSSRPKHDIKPDLFEVPGNPSRDFRKEREALKKQYDLEKRNLDLEEEIRLLRDTRPAVKTEPGVGEVKPDITRLDGGSRLKPLGLGLVEDSDDEEDIVFIREVKGGRAAPSISGKSSPCFGSLD